MLETDGALWIQVALPGVTPEQLQVGIEGNALVVTGERTLPVPRGAGVIRRLEMPYGAFERRIELPAGRYELVAARPRPGLPHPDPAQARLSRRERMADQPDIDVGLADTARCRPTCCRWCRCATSSCSRARWCR